MSSSPNVVIRYTPFRRREEDMARRGGGAGGGGRREEEEEEEEEEKEVQGKRTVDSEEGKCITTRKSAGRVVLSF